MIRFGLSFAMHTLQMYALSLLYLLNITPLFILITGFFQASERLHEKMTNFVSKNKAAQIHQGSRLALWCLLAFGLVL